MPCPPLHAPCFEALRGLSASLIYDDFYGRLSKEKVPYLSRQVFDREAVEDGLNVLRDRLAAVMIELQEQKEDDVEMKNREIQELVEEHRRIVETLEEDWKGEVVEAKGHVEELCDVHFLQPCFRELGPNNLNLDV